MSKTVTQGTKLYVEDADNPGSFLAVGNLTRIPSPGPTKPEIDVTDMDSTGAEFLLGIPDFGNLDFEGWFNKANAGQQQMRDDGVSVDSTARNFRIEYTTQNLKATFSGTVKAFTIDARVNNAYTFSGQIRTTAAPTFANISSE